MGQRFLIDTNVVIDYLGGKLPSKGHVFIASQHPIVSAVTIMEAAGWYRATPAQIETVQLFLEPARVLPIDDAVMNRTVLERQQRKLQLGDSIIAATALVHGLTLITRNTKDFAGIPGLAVVNPWEL